MLRARSNNTYLDVPGVLWEPIGGRTTRSGDPMGVDWGTLEAHWGMDRFSDRNMLIRSTLLFGSTLPSAPQR